MISEILKQILLSWFFKYNNNFRVNSDKIAGDENR